MKDILKPTKVVLNDNRYEEGIKKEVQIFRTKYIPSQFHFDGKVLQVSWQCTTPWSRCPHLNIFKLDRSSVFHVDLVSPGDDHLEPGLVLRDHDVGPLLHFQRRDVVLIIRITVDMKADLNR